LGQGQRRYDLDPETYELYLKARALAERRDRAGPQKAVEMFEQVITRDPSFAPAYAGLVNAYAWMSMLPYQGASFQTAQSIMRPAALKAVELDPLLAEAHAAMGWVSSRDFDWEKAEKSFRHAIELNPSLTQIYSDFSVSTLRTLGRFDEAEQLMQAAREIDPLSLDVLREIGQLQFLAGRYVDAITTLQQVYAADPDLPFVKVFLGRSLSFAGRVTEAIPLLGDPRNNHYAAHAYVRAGRRVDVEKVAVTHAGYPQRLAVIYAALEDKDRTLAMLERMIADEPHRVAINLSFPEFAFLQGDPRLAALRKTLNLPRDPAAFNPSERPIIAVLPFKNLSSEAGSEYFVDGLTDELIRNLAVIEGLAVRSQTSSFFFKDKPRNLREVGKQLGANLVVEGSVLRSGNRLRINAQLVPVSQDVPLWSGRFNRELKDIFAIQDEISLAIVNKLRLTLGRGQRRYELDPEAYALYLKGRALVGRSGVPSLEEAAGLFEAAVARDPGFAPAHAGLAMAYALMSTPVGSTLPFGTAHAVLRPAAVKALELDPLLADAHAAMGWQLDRCGARLPARHRTQSEPDSKLHRLFVVDACTARQGRGSVGSSPIRAAKRSIVTRCSARDRGSPIVRRAFRRGDRDSAARSRGRSRPSVRGRMAGARADVCRQARRGGAPTGKKRRPPSRSLQARAVWTRAAPRVLICRDRQTRGRRSAAGPP
jgi:TolB-like protein/Tfp pilus assembly protein PilF